MLFPKFSDIIISKNNRLFKDIIMKKPRIKYDDFVGKKINQWTIISYFYLKNRMQFLCSCECGTNSIIQASQLIYNRTQSCKYCAPKKHGMYNTSENRSWHSARNRCNNPNNKDYSYYGARGIKFSEKWKKFEDFYADMGPKPKGYTLDRINNNGHYEPGNCRWATYSQQNTNQRKRISSKLITEGN